MSTTFDAGTVHAQLELDRKQFNREMSATKKELAAFEKKRYEANVGLNLKTLRADVLRANKMIAGVGSDKTAGIKVSLDTKGAWADYMALRTKMAAMPAIDIKANVDRNSKRDVDALGDSLRSAGRAASEAGSSAVSSGSSFAKMGGIIALVAAIAAPAVGAIATAIAALPSLIMVAAGAMGAIALGMDGIKKAAEAAAPALAQMKAEVSTSFYKALLPAMQGIAQIMPQVTGGFQQVATALGGMATQVVNMLKTNEMVEQLNGLLTGTMSVIQAMTPAVVAFVKNFMLLADSGLENFMMPLAEGLSYAAEAFGRMITYLQSTGELQAAFTNLAGTINTLVLGLNALIGAGIQAYAVIGGPFNTALGLIIAAVVALMPILTAVSQIFFAVLNPVLEALIGIITALTPALTLFGQLFSQLATGVLMPLVPIVTQIAQVLGDTLLAVFQALAPIIPVVVGAFQTLATALAPIVPILGGMVVQLAQGLAPIIPIIASAIQGLVPVAVTLIGAFLQIWQALTPLIPLFLQLVNQLLPPLQGLINALLPIFQMLATVIADFVSTAVVPMIGMFIQMISTILPPLVDLIGQLAPVIGILAGAFMQVLVALLPIIPPILQLTMSLLPPLMQLVSALMPLITSLASVFVQLLTSAIVPLITVFAQLLSIVLPPLVTLLQTVLIPVISFLANVISTVLVWVIQNLLMPAVSAIIPIFQAMGDIANWLWQNVIVPVAAGLAVAFQAIWEAAQWMWFNVIKPVFDAFGLAARVLFAVIMTVLITPLILAWNAVAAAATWLWENVLRPVFQAIGDFIKWVWDAILKPTFDALVSFWQNVLQPAALWLWNNVLKPTFQAIGDFIKWVCDFLIKPALDALVFFWENILAPAATWLWNNVIKPTFQAIGDFIMWVWTNIIKPAFDAVVGGLDWLGENFVRVTDWIRDIWNRIRGYLAKPINFMIDVVWNKGVVPAWNAVAGLVGLGPINPLPLIPEFATGGPVHGPGTTTSDSIPARLSRDEHVWTAREVRGAGGHENVARIRKMAKAGALPEPRQALYADGGPVLGFADGGAWRGMWDQVRGVFPSATLNSAYRPGDPGHHGTGNAVDLGGPLGAINQWIAGRATPSTELIYTPGINLDNGRPHTYNAATQADHYDHVHWAEAGGGGAGGGGFFNWILDKMRSVFDSITNPAIEALRSAVGEPPPEWRRVPPALATKMRDTVRDFLFGKAEASGGGGMDVSGISGPVVDQVRQVADRFGWGAGPEWDAIVRLVQKESSWDPGAANPTSSARGLFQKMTSLHGPVEPTPAGQAAWGLNYIRGRYGSPTAAWRFHMANGSYDRGGALLPGTSIIHNAMKRPETIVPLPPSLMDNLLAQGTNRIERMATPIAEDEIKRISSSMGDDGWMSRKMDELIDAVVEGGGVRIDNVNTIDTARELAEEINFRVRKSRRGGVHG